MSNSVSQKIKACIDEATSVGWPDPQPLSAKIEQEPYPIDALPEIIRKAVEEVQGFVKAPISLVASSAESFTVHGARLTMALQVQEGTLRSFFEKSGSLARDTGFLARFLIAWPESTQGKRFFTKAPTNWPHLAELHKRITQILAIPVQIDTEGALIPNIMSFTASAKAAWVEFHDGIESELISSGELYDIRDVASKSADNAARMAALFQILEMDHMDP